MQQKCYSVLVGDDKVKWRCTIAGGETGCLLWQKNVTGPLIGGSVSEETKRVVCGVAAYHIIGRQFGQAERCGWDD